MGNYPLSRWRLAESMKIFGPNSKLSGTHHWWWQRLSAICLVPLSLWFVFSILSQLNSNYADVIQWISSAPVTLLLILFFCAVFYHAKLGLEVIAEDYVHNPPVLTLIKILIKSIVILGVLVSVTAIIKISFFTS
jgi:succinate dehydrogenase / fumarate reductase membrane anchor subunit